ncbi:MAG: hypothetical protein COA79_06520 [Planctomycetota bacterium]|nr:MAG: hypothetical protein COA79_06520 [Planctomycetota bacterium]
MKNLIMILFSLLVMTGFIYGESSSMKNKDAIVLIREFKSIIRNNLYLDFKESVKKLRNIKKDILKKHHVYEDLFKIIKNKKKDYFVLMRQMSIEMLIDLYLENHHIVNLESELLKILIDENEAIPLRKYLIETLPDVLTREDLANSYELKNVFLKILSKKIKLKDDSRVLELKQAVFRKLSLIKVGYNSISVTIKRELNDKNSKLKISILYYLLDYSLSNNRFSEYEIKRFCKKIFLNRAGEFSNMDIAKAINLYANMLKNESGRIQKSDEKIFLDFLKNNDEDIMIAAATSLYKINSIVAVGAIIKRLKEVDTKSLSARNNLILALGYLEGNLLRFGKGESSLNKIALNEIKDVFLLILPKIKINDPILNKVLDAINMFGLEDKAEKYFKLKSLKKIIKYLRKTKDEKIKIKVSELLTNFTGMPFNTNVELWDKWVKAEDSKPRSKFN